MQVEGERALKDFEYTAPGTLREAVKLLAEKGDSARAMAGGTDLIVQMRINRRQPERVVDIKNVPELNELTFTPRTGLRTAPARCVVLPTAFHESEGSVLDTTVTTRSFRRQSMWSCSAR